MTNKEQIYDERVAPLMEEIIEICTEHKIAMLASFSVPDGTTEGADLMCTTSLLKEEFGPQKCQLEAIDKIIVPQRVRLSIIGKSS
jgi:hypothetical protein